MRAAALRPTAWSGELPLIGREEELSFLTDAVREQAGAILGGAAGVGKTRLARAVAARLPGWSVSWATVTPAVADLPFGGLAGLGLLGDDHPLDRSELLSRLSSRLLDRAGGRPVLVVVDDAHLLDELSAVFLHRLVSSRTARVLLSVRSGETAPDAILSLSKDRLLPRLEVQPLGAVDFRAIVSAALGAPVAAETVARLWTATAGNTLFLRELIGDALEAGTLSATDGLWTWEPGRSVGPRLAELVAHRMGRLEGDRRTLVELLAVGEPLGTEMIEALMPGTDLAAHERCGLVAVEEEGRRLLVRLAHPLFGEVVRARLPVVERRRLQRLLADALEATGERRQDDLLRVAVWRLESASPTDPAKLTQAARLARQEFDPSLAVRLAEASIRLAPTFEAAVILGSALGALARFEEAAAVLDGQVGNEPSTLARQHLARERAWVAFQRAEGLDRPRAILERAEAAGDDTVVRLLARGDLALLLAYAGRFAEALEVGRPLVEPGIDDLVRLRSLPAVGACLVLGGRVDEALALCDDLEAAADRRSTEMPEALGWLWQMRTNALLLGGRLDDALEVLGPALEPGAARTLGPGDLAYARTKLGLLHLLAGRPASALGVLNEAAVALSRLDPNGCLAWCLSLAAQARAQLGEIEAAARLAEEATSECVRRFPVWEGDAARARAWVAACRGERRRAIEEFLAAAQSEESSGQPAFALMSLHDAVRFGARDAAPRLENVARTLDGPLAAAAAALAQAARGGDASGFDTAASAFAELGLHPAAADAAAQAAAGWQAAGLRARAQRAARLRDAQLALCEAPGVLAVPAPSTDRPSLTQRELEMALLASRGLSNGEIAERLVLSIRTVESHLYNAYSKLGVADRRDLAVALSAEVRATPQWPADMRGSRPGGPQ